MNKEEKDLLEDLKEKYDKLESYIYTYHNPFFATSIKKIITEIEEGFETLLSEP